LSKSDTFCDKSNAFSSCSEHTSMTSNSDTSSCWDDASDREGDINNLDPMKLCKRRRLERVLKMKMKRSNKSRSNLSCQHSTNSSELRSRSSLDKSQQRRLSNRESAERSRLKKNMLIDALTARNCEYFVELQDLLGENEQLKTLLSSHGLLLQSQPLQPQSQLLVLCDGAESFCEEPQRFNDEVHSALQQSFERIFDYNPDDTLDSSLPNIDSMCFDWTLFDWI